MPGLGGPGSKGRKHRKWLSSSDLGAWEVGGVMSRNQAGLISRMGLVGEGAQFSLQ